MQNLINKADNTAKQLKLIANPLRLIVLCSLVEGDKNVTELINITGASQTLVSNHLALLRKANIIDYHRDHRTLNYYLKDQRMTDVLDTLYRVYCQS